MSNNEVTNVHIKKVWCNGMPLHHPEAYLEMNKESVTGHPKVYLVMKEDKINCPYCNRLFVYSKPTKIEE